ncbi:MAG TPA: transcriptional repressor [Clostridiaceae bacterium]|nr:transcriptional repressor [Clostridiaceae bacterium]
MIIGDYLKENNIKPSYLRIKVMEYLLKYKNHPSADQIYKKLVVDIPTLSKTTIYNILNLFLEKKIVQPIVIEENETRYDADIRIHGHFKCEVCGTIYDLPIDISTLKVEGLDKFQVNESHIYFKGICYKCLQKNK